MKYALISPPEGDRFCQVEDAPFPVAAPLHWVECAADVTPTTHRYVDGAFEALPLPEPSPSGDASGVTEL